MRKFINIVLFFRWDSTLNSPNVAKQAKCNDCKKYAIYQVINKLLKCPELLGPEPIHVR